MATDQRTRDDSAAVLLRVPYELSPINRAGVARLSDLTRTTVADCGPAFWTGRGER